MIQELEKKITAATESWKELLGESLDSLYLFGSAVRGDWSPKTSDINVLLLHRDDVYKHWPTIGEQAKRWRKRGFALPLFLTESYIQSALDVFPIEFLEMKLFHEVLYGTDIFESIEINNEHLRNQAEREIRGKWVQLRQASLERYGDTVELRNLLAMSVPTWVSVFQAILVIHNQSVPSDKMETISRGAEIAGVDAKIFHNLLKMRKEKRAMNRKATWDTMLETLGQVDNLIQYVDRDLQ